MSQSQRTVASLGLPQALQDQLSAANYVYVDDLKGVRPIELARDLKVPNEEATAGRRLGPYSLGAQVEYGGEKFVPWFRAVAPGDFGGATRGGGDFGGATPPPFRVVRNLLRDVCSVFHLHPKQN